MTLEIFGYMQNSDAEAPARLEEVSFRADPPQLRTIAKFFNHCADLIETHAGDFGHEHLSDFAKELEGGPAVIVAGPPSGVGG